MKSPWGMFSDCFNILAKNLTLFWPVIIMAGILSLISSSMAAAFQESQEVWTNPIFIAMAVVFLAVLMAFAAGIYHMAFQAVTRELKPAPEKANNPPNPLESFTLLLEFLPGVSTYFARFFIGGIIHLLVISGLVALFVSVFQYMGGYPASFLKLVDKGSLTMGELQHYAQTLPAADQTFFENIFLVGSGLLLIYAVFNILTMLWPVYAIARDTKILKAFGLSLGAYLKKPLHLIAIILMYGVVKFAITLAFINKSDLLVSLSAVLTLMGDLWFLLTLNYFVISLEDAESSKGALKSGADANEKPPTDSAGPHKISFDA